MKIAAFSLLATASLANGNLLVDYVYTYGTPAIVKHPHHANPGNRCIPGIRVYTENFGWPWWASWAGVITNTDFAARINAGFGYGHPKMSTLVLRDVENRPREYLWFECKDSDGEDYYDWEWYPSSTAVFNALPGFHIHSIDLEYEPRLKSFFDGDSQPLGVQATATALEAPLLDYTSVAWCNGQPWNTTIDCLARYSEDHMGVDGVAPLGWEVDAQMEHVTSHAIGDDSDRVYILKNDADPSFRKCIISFQGSRENADLASFVRPASTGFCGRYGVHTGVRNELWQLIADPQWGANIKPSLEQCHEVTCVGHSLGGALCNAFTMCANTGPEYLEGNTDAGMQNDYDMIAWNKKTGAANEQRENVAAATE